MSKLSRFVYNKGHQKSREITREIWRSERELYHCQNYWNFDPECEYSKHKAFRVRKATGTFKKQAPGDIRRVKGIIVYLTKSCLISYGRKLLILRSKPSVWNTLFRRYVEITRPTDDLSLKT